MKLKIILSAIILSCLSLCAENLPFAARVETRTNTVNVPASGIIAAHTITTATRYVWVVDNEDGQFYAYPQPAIRILSTETNLITASARPTPPNRPQPPSVQNRGTNNVEMRRGPQRGSRTNSVPRGPRTNDVPKFPAKVPDKK